MDVATIRSCSVAEAIAEVDERVRLAGRVDCDSWRCFGGITTSPTKTLWGTHTNMYKQYNTNRVTHKTQSEVQHSTVLDERLPWIAGD